MTGTAGLAATARNSRVLSLKDVPWLLPSRFREWLVQGVRDKGRRVAAYFGSADEAIADVALTAVLADDANGRLFVARTASDGTTFESVVPEVRRRRISSSARSPSSTASGSRDIRG